MFLPCATFLFVRFAWVFWAFTKHRVESYGTELKKMPWITWRFPARHGGTPSLGWLGSKQLPFGLKIRHGTMGNLIGLGLPRDV